MLSNWTQIACLVQLLSSQLQMLSQHRKRDQHPLVKCFCQAHESKFHGHQLIFDAFYIGHCLLLAEFVQTGSHHSTENATKPIGSSLLERIQMTPSIRKRRARVPSSLAEALQQCLDHALAKFNRSPKRIADLMGVKIDTLYKWLSENRIPANMIGPFEHACGATFLTQYLCAQAHLLAVEMPRGRKVNASDVMDLQQHFAESIALLILFYKGESDQEDTVTSLQALMGQVAWHKANVERAASPELDLFEVTA